MKRITWDWIIERANKGDFGDLLITNENDATRGPLEKVYRDGDYIVFKLIWLARAKIVKTGTTGWHKIEGSEIKVPSTIEMEFNMSNTLKFTLPGVGQVDVFRKHTGYLEPHEVYGLDPDDVRQSRAWMYGIPLDSKWERIIHRVVHDLGSDGLVDSFDQIRVQDEAVQFAVPA